MSTRIDEVMNELLALPPDQRLDLALRIWESLSDADRAAACPPEPAVLAEVRRRDEALSTGTVTGRSHDDVMAAARGK
ncbi:MAG TPA: addiction module protein [Planctomycetaceae bacterium]